MSNDDINTSEGKANSLFENLTSWVSVPDSHDLDDSKFTFSKDPNSPLYSEVKLTSVDNITDVCLEGEGVFDKMMAAISLHLKDQFDKGRISGTQYAEVYSQSLNQTMSTAASYVLQNDINQWQAIKAQMDARISEIQATTALVDLEKVRMESAKASFDMNLSAAMFSKEKMGLSIADEEFKGVKFDNDVKEFTITNLLDEQLEKAQEDVRNAKADADIKEYTLTNQLPKQVELIENQVTLTAEQFESERAKTSDIRSDGSPILGSVGKQKDLYTQQIDSFIKDSQHKTAKMYLDAWITQKTLDEGLSAPGQLTNTEIDEVLTNVRGNNNLGS